MPAPIVWDFHHDQTFVHNTGNAFSIKYIGIWPQEFSFIYAYKFLEQASPEFTVFASFSSTANNETNLKTSVQPLGIIDGVHTGVIHAIRTSYVGQTIGLRITVPEPHPLSWRLNPLLKQLIEEPHRDTTKEAIMDDLGQVGITSVEFYGPVMNEQVAYFRPTAAQSSSHKTYIFIRMDSPNITTITKEQYLAIAGSMNFQE